MTTIAPPPPAPAAPPHVPEGGRTAIRVALVVLAALLVVGGVGALTVTAFGIGGFRVVTDTTALPRGLRALTIDTADGGVAIRVRTDRAATEPRVDARMLVTGDSPRQPLSVVNDANGSRVTVGDSSSPRPMWGRLGEITVVLPPDTARGMSLTADLRNGIVAVDADLDRVVATVNNGAVAIEGSVRQIEATVRHGDITISLRGAPRSIEAVTDTGDVTIELPGAGPYRVRAQSDGRQGDTTVTVPETTDPQAPQVSARSGRGDVTIEERR